MTQIDTYGADNIRRANELKEVVNDWYLKEFNQINMSVYDRLSEGCLFEFIRPISDQAAVDRFSDIVNSETEDEFKVQACEHCFCDKNQLSEIEFENYLLNERLDDVRSYLSEHDDNDHNYPMWCTLFEFRCEPSEELIGLAQAAGFGVIEGLDDFNTTLFVAGAGYSFMGAHFIPLYLSYFTYEKEKWANIDFQCV